MSSTRSWSLRRLLANVVEVRRLLLLLLPAEWDNDDGEHGPCRWCNGNHV